METDIVLMNDPKKGQGLSLEVHHIGRKKIVNWQFPHKISYEIGPKPKSKRALDLKSFRTQIFRGGSNK